MASHSLLCASFDLSTLLSDGSRNQTLASDGSSTSLVSPFSPMMFVMKNADFNMHVAPWNIFSLIFIFVYLCLKHKISIRELHGPGPGHGPGLGRFFLLCGLRVRRETCSAIRGLAALDRAETVRASRAGMLPRGPDSI